MDKLLVVVVGILCGVGQFFLLRAALKPLAEGKPPNVVKMLLSQLPIPLVLLLGCAYINVDLLLFAGVAFSLSMVLASVAYHLITLKKKG